MNLGTRQVLSIANIDKDFSGTHNIDFILPDNQQKGVVKVWTDAWMRQYTEIYKTLQTDTGFVGTLKEPTVLAFGTSRPYSAGTATL